MKRISQFATPLQMRCTSKQVSDMSGFLSLVASSPLRDQMLVEIKCINVRRNTTVFQIVEENNYKFRPFSGWAIIRLRLENRRKLIYYNVDIKHGERDLPQVFPRKGPEHVVVFFNNLKYSCVTTDNYTLNLY
jgi:hypothetical protein